jgi:hypothetical protein
MRNSLLTVAFLLGILGNGRAETSLTIYNDFAVIRDSLKLDLKPGVSDVRYAEVALFAELNSVILRDPSGKTERTESR